MWPLEVFNMPWVQVTEFWNSLMKRKRRDTKIQASMHGVPIGSTSPSGVAREGPTDSELIQFVSGGSLFTGSQIGPESIKFVDKIGD